MADALTIAVQGMQNDMQRMDIISQNVVNSATPGYRRALSANQSFGEVLQNSAIPGADHSMAISLPAVTSFLDPAAGPVKSTGNPLDLAINGEGYFELTTPEGPAYTRAGNFHIDASGHLVNQDGYAVSGESGDIVSRDNNLSISSNGEIKDGGTTVGQLRIVSFADKHKLETTMRGLLIPQGDNEATSVAAPQLQIGYIESANVVPLNEMINMLETSRHFESQQKLFQGYDEQLSNAIQKLGQF
ncbi:MAG: flagellar hook basal-body protein [Burkholderiaceae bacterium]|nr:flagellar hook basal-body protein [Burkholderiaceae bacterium]